VSLGSVSGYQYNDVLMKVDSMAAFTGNFGATILNRLVQFAPRRPAPHARGIAYPGRRLQHPSGPCTSGYSSAAKRRRAITVGSRAYQAQCGALAPWQLNTPPSQAPLSGT
jgi:hypothetical protein